MVCCLGRKAWGLLPALGICLGTQLAQAQGASGAFPADPAPPAAPPPQPAPPPAATPAPVPPPQTAPPPAAPPPAAAPAPPPPYAADPNAPPGYVPYPEPPPPPAPPQRTSPIPPFSIRVDPLNWILEGQLGFELEVGLAKWLSVETVPMFVTNDRPPLLNLGGGDTRILQHSNGIGPLAGATIGVNFWPQRVFKGYVLRTGLINYGLSYEAQDNGKQIDTFAHTKREFYVMLGSVERWGPFTLGGGFGLAYDLNKQSRCFPDHPSSGSYLTSADAGSGDCGELQMLVPADNGFGTKVPTPVTVSDFIYPWEILARISLGVTID